MAGRDRAHDSDAAEGAGRASFEVDVAGLLEALTEQFPEPLLCVRELVQNAADAGAGRIDVEVSFDGARDLVRISVRDDGRGMGSVDIEGYLTIGFSDKDPSRQRGRFGIGKLSPYALGFERMVVETSNGIEAARIELAPDGSGRVEPRSPGPRGTEVRVYKMCGREEAHRLSSRVYEIARESCGSMTIPLLVNGVAVNQAVGLSTRYAVRFESDAGEGVIGVAAEPVRTLMGGGIVLESGAPILGPEVSYALDAPRLSPTLSRNAVRRDQAFETLLQHAQSALQRLTYSAGRVLEERVGELRRTGAVVERALDPDDRAAIEWLRARLLDPELEPSAEVKSAPVLETADGDLVSASALADVLRRERRIPISRVPRTPEEIAGYADRGVPVLLLYRDLEDFLERQNIETVEVDGLDDGVEIAPTQLARGEVALVARPRLAPPHRLGSRGALAWIGVAASALVLVLFVGLGWPSERAVDPSSMVAESSGAPTSPVGAEVGPGPSLPLILLAALSTLVAVLSAAAGGGLLLSGAQRRQRMKAWLRKEAGVPLAQGDGRRRRLSVLIRMMLNPIDFAVARGWSLRSSRPARRSITGYRAFAAPTPIRAGARLDLDRLELGIVELLSRTGEPSDAKVFVRRDDRVLLNRNHPTIRDLTVIAAADPTRARVLLEALLATDGELAGGCDPRQVEWDLVARAPRVLGTSG